MSNNTSTKSPQASDPPASPTTSVPLSSSANPPTTASTPDISTSVPPTTLPPTASTSETPTTPTPTTHPPTSTTPGSTTPPPTTASTSTISAQPSTILRTSVVTASNGGVTSTFVTVITQTPDPGSTGTQTSASTSATTSSSAAINPSDNPSGGLGNSEKIAVAVVVPIAAVALLVLAGIYLWRKRKQRKDAEEQRRKEVEDYAYNPNADPTIPAVAGAAGAYEMKEDATSGYRGWGSTTLAGSAGRKASTAMSGGAMGVAYSDGTSPTHGNISDTRSAEPLMNDGPPHSPEGEILGAMGPTVANNRADVHRGPSNASSSYSAAARSDGSGEGGIGVAYGGGPGYYDHYSSNNPYTDGAHNNRPGPPPSAEFGGQAVIRDVTARRNTRIENPAHYPQQSAGISQNF